MTGVSEVSQDGRIVGHALIEPSADPDVDYVAHIVWLNPADEEELP